MAKSKWKLPPLYIPSSGSMVRVKFRISSGFGKDVLIVRPRVPSSSARSDGVGRIRQGVSAERAGGLMFKPYLSVLVVELLSLSSFLAPPPQRLHPFAAAVSVVVCQSSTPGNSLLAKASWATVFKLTIDHIFNILMTPDVGNVQ